MEMEMLVDWLVKYFNNNFIYNIHFINNYIITVYTLNISDCIL